VQEKPLPPFTIMKEDKIYKLLVSKMQEIALVPPQTIGSFTPLYKKIVPRFKYYPWKSALIISLASTISLYLVLGSTLVKIASLLQFGF